MFFQGMGSSWNFYGIQLLFFSVLILVLEIQGHCLLNSEGVALLEFRARVELDPYSIFSDWNPNDCDPCMWSGVHCVENQVQMLDLNGLSLEGVLAPELGRLASLKILILSQNQFYGTIPKEFGGLSMLEVLDLRNNCLNGTIPVELDGIHSLKRLLLYNNNFEGSSYLQHGNIDLLSKSQYEYLGSKAAAGVSANRKIRHCSLFSNARSISDAGLQSLRESKCYIIQLKRTFTRYLNMLPMFKFEEGFSCDDADGCCDLPPSHSEQHILNLFNVVRRRLAEQSSNLAAAPARESSPFVQIIALPSTRSSGSFPAVPKKKQSPPPVPSPVEPPTNWMPYNESNSVRESGNLTKVPSGHSANLWKYIVGISIAALLLVVSLALFFICRTRAVKTTGPWKTGLSGQLQKAFVTGVPRLNRTELETACEDFSNIIETRDCCIMYKGTLSSGVEIAVISTTVNSLKDWSPQSEVAYLKKIDALSRVNHKNFSNLIGYCDEDEPFTRMMVFEYAPNGTLSEHLHTNELEHLDWNARMRIIMGIAYCLRYMHDKNPPLPHSNLNANAIFLTEDYAAKIAEVEFWKELSYKSRGSDENDSEHSALPPLANTESNVYSFGVLLLEVVSGKLPDSEEQGPLVDWAAEYLKEKRSYMIDPTLKSYEDEHQDILCEIIQDCIQQDARKRPTANEIISKLSKVIDVSPDAAVPRSSPLWWAELEILSAETS